MLSITEKVLFTTVGFALGTIRGTSSDDDGNVKEALEFTGLIYAAQYVTKTTIDLKRSRRSLEYDPDHNDEVMAEYPFYLGVGYGAGLYAGNALKNLL